MMKQSFSSKKFSLEYLYVMSGEIFKIAITIPLTQHDSFWKIFKKKYIFALLMIIVFNSITD